MLRRCSNICSLEKIIRIVAQGLVHCYWYIYIFQIKQLIHDNTSRECGRNRIITDISFLVTCLFSCASRWDENILEIHRLIWNAISNFAMRKPQQQLNTTASDLLLSKSKEWCIIWKQLRINATWGSHWECIGWN